MRLIEVLEVVKMLKIEPFIFITVFAYGISSVVSGLFLQDKLCRLTFNQTVDFCTNINEIKSDPIKDEILTKSADLNLIKTIIHTIPMVLWSLLMGSWTDKYIHGRKVLMMASCLSAMTSSGLYIMNALYFNISKGSFYLISFIKFVNGSFQVHIGFSRLQFQKHSLVE